MSIIYDFGICKHHLGPSSLENWEKGFLISPPNDTRTIVTNNTIMVLNTQFSGEILVLDNKFIYNICSAVQDLQNEL